MHFPMQPISPMKKANDLFQRKMRATPRTLRQPNPPVKNALPIVSNAPSFVRIPRPNMPRPTSAPIHRQNTPIHRQNPRPQEAAPSISPSFGISEISRLPELPSCRTSSILLSCQTSSILPSCRTSSSQPPHLAKVSPTSSNASKPAKRRKYSRSLLCRLPCSPATKRLCILRIRRNASNTW
jgi:hypothetical protein